jgi:YVTN family beta-propeller protein
MAFAQDGDRIYVTNTISKSISVIDVRASKVIFTVKVGNHPYSIAHDPTLSRLVIANRLADSLSVVNINSRREEIQINVGAEPDGIGFVHDHREYFVINDHGKAISVINAGSLNISTTILLPRAAQAFGAFIMQ